MKERPILMCGEMVRQTLAGNKTQTRRIVKPQPEVHRVSPPRSKNGFKPGHLMLCPDLLDAMMNAPETKYVWTVATAEHSFRCMSSDVFAKEFCPYGVPGDRLWVKETFGLHYGIVYRATDNAAPSGGWKPSIFMKREHSRITLEITGIRVERVQDITQEDAVAEGFNNRGGIWGRRGFEKTWDTLNAKRGFGWVVNPWVWVIEFKRVDSGLPFGVVVDKKE